MDPPIELTSSLLLIDFFNCCWRRLAGSHRGVGGELGEDRGSPRPAGCTRGPQPADEAAGAHLQRSAPPAQASDGRRWGCGQEARGPQCWRCRRRCFFKRDHVFILADCSGCCRNEVVKCYRHGCGVDCGRCGGQLCSDDGGAREHCQSNALIAQCTTRSGLSFKSSIGYRQHR